MYGNLAEVIIALENKIIEQEKIIDLLSSHVKKQDSLIEDLNSSCIILKSMADAALEIKQPKVSWGDYFKPGVN